jgi:hypothetical protein
MYQLDFWMVNILKNNFHGTLQAILYKINKTDFWGQITPNLDGCKKVRSRNDPSCFAEQQNALRKTFHETVSSKTLGGPCWRRITGRQEHSRG